ncbi:hypothetical protein DL89DRAFT_254808 [Linderina pennispora]|uniref:Thioesterase domain-containing protein n=1 Tax=Linderina pennispora TaxID=61395 RepID=A0A1Y1WGZ7_9FUNG|nr:uncharacterized protein DL89DRAFT_254808 [Linderina pennispora]ORX72608.1 hypothetical protein DL89DRAFT_254808 [Linderina pennispora]
MTAAPEFTSPVPAEELTRRAETYHKQLLASNVKLTTPPVSRLQLVSIKPTGAKGDRVTSAFLTFTFSVENTDCNTWGTIHGGCVFTLFNAAGKIATAVVANGAKKIVSTDLTTNYLAGVPVNSTVTLEIECLRTTKSIGFLRGCIKDEKGNLAYIATQNVSFEL